jgi:hypothetical protein
MQTDETERHVVYQCLHCGVVVQIAKSAKA